jgi:precorrin-6A/cobalt-precorrin-6A reductase
MILVLAGTQDGRELVTALSESGYAVMVSVVSNYGRELVQNINVMVNACPLDSEGMMAIIDNHGIQLIIDASHPYAANVSRNAMLACQAKGIFYLRYERPATMLPAYQHLYLVSDYTQAAQTAAKLGNIIFLTTGSRMLKAFKAEPLLASHRLIARVLPDPAVLVECLAMGFKPRDIVALQGPFSHELNVALFKAYAADVIVTKNSGEIGGSDTKFTAAVALTLPLVVIDRPAVQYSAVVASIPEVINFVKEIAL